MPKLNYWTASLLITVIMAGTLFVLLQPGVIKDSGDLFGFLLAGLLIFTLPFFVTLSLMAKSPRTTRKLVRNVLIAFTLPILLLLLVQPLLAIIPVVILLVVLKWLFSSGDSNTTDDEYMGSWQRILDISKKR